MKRLVCIMLMTLMTLMLSAASFTSLWKKVRDAEDKDMPKTALEYIMKIEQKAEKEQNYGNLLAAIMRELYMQQEVSYDSLKAAKARLAAKQTMWRNSQHGVEATLADVAMGCEVIPMVDSLLASPDSAIYRKQNKAAEYAPFIVKGEDSRYFGNDLLSMMILMDDHGVKTTNILEKYYGKENKVVSWRRVVEAIDKERDSGNKIVLIDKAVEEWKGWKCLNTLKNKRESLIQPQYRASVRKNILSTKDTVRIAFRDVRNIDALTITLKNNKGGERKVKQTFSIENEWDYANDTAAVVPPLSLGKWTVYISDEKGRVRKEVDTLYVTDLKVIVQKLPKGEKNIVVVNPVTGKEVTGAQVFEKKGYYYATMGEDDAMPKSEIWTSYSCDKPSGVRNYMNVYTDRAIYRRGQTIHATVISHAVINGKETLPNVSEKVKITLRDTYGREVTSKTVVTDTYGTAVTEFVIPNEGTNGSYRVSASGSASTTAYIKVEDYKRPTFDVTLEKEGDEEELGDTAVIRGVVKMYSGVPVANAKVTYQVKRSNAWWIGRLDGETLLKDTLFTDADGIFQARMPLPLPANVDTKWYYCFRYTLSASVTDNGGETHSQSITLTKKNDRPIKPESVEKPEPVTVSSDNFGEKGEVTITLRNEGMTYAHYTLCAGDRTLEKGCIEFADSVTHTLNYTEKYGDGVTFSVAWVKNGRMYDKSVSVKKYLPSKKLSMEWSTFRDKLYPGQTETWTLKVKNPDGTPSNAQLMAVMYDKSLDAIMPFDWRLYDNRRLHLPSMYWNTNRIGQCYFWGAKNLSPLSESVLEFYHIEPEYIFGRYGYYPVGGARYMAGMQFEKGMMLDAAPTMVMAKNARLEESADIAESNAADNDGNDGAQNVEMRSDFNETAFFLPRVQADKNGVATLKFTMPESVTTWKFMALAHDKEMRYALMDSTAITQKKIMVQAKMPRFLRIGDKATISATVANLMEKNQMVTIRFFVKDAETEKTVYKASKKVTTQAGRTAPVVFAYNVEKEGDLLCGFTAEIPGFSDGEQYLIPVLTEEEIKEDTTTIAVNPRKMMMEALPAMTVPKSRNAIALAHAIYANVITAKIKNTPVSAANDNVLVQLLNLQNADGGFSWYGGMRSNGYITIEVLKTLARLNLMCGKQTNTEYMMDRAFVYASKQMEAEMQRMKKYDVRYLSYTALDWLYTLAISNRDGGSAESFFRKMIYEETKGDDMQTKAVAAITLNENGKRKKAAEFAESIKQHTVYREDMGRYFDSYRALYSWCDYKIPTHTMCVEALENVTPNDEQTISEMLRWLVSAKRTQRWDNPVNTVNAIYALYNVKDTTIMSTYTVNPADLKGALKITREVSGIMKVGEKVKVKLTIEADRDYDFVTVTDNRAACLEPVNQLSGFRGGYRWGYYAEMRDSKSIYHFDQMSKGRHVVETEYYVNRTGEYQTGNATVVCEYAPEFRGSVEAITIKTK
ncbi:MAG: hypothetical protein IKQ32_02015 [Prevotella sp.]|nr:hypothetical protein [Prevotella sp.]